MRRILALMLFTLAAGCSLLVPQTTALEGIHDIYREEFAEQIVPPRATYNRPALADPKERAFTKTLQSIRSFRVEYGEDSAQSKHLDVLEGMIFLQSGRFQMAHAVEGRVQKSIGKLKSGSGSYARDELFARAFPNLLKGWENSYRITGAPSGTPNLPISANFLEDATAIEGLLLKLDPSKLADPEVDQGAIYLATSAAIFFVWAYDLDIARPKPLLERARDLVGKFLSDSEKSLKGQEQVERSVVGRLRYVEWYQWLKKNAQP